MVSHKKIYTLSAVLFVALAIFAAVLVTRLRQGDSTTKTTTIEGTLDCLPHKGSGPSTLECAFGVKAPNGAIYGLRNFKDTAIHTNDKIKVTGTLQSAPANDRYDTAGYITVSSVTKR